MERPVGQDSASPTEAEHRGTAWMPEPTQPEASPPSASAPASGRCRSWLLYWECCAGPPEVSMVPFGSTPAPPLFPASTALLLAPVDRLVAWCSRFTSAVVSSKCAPPELSVESAEEAVDAPGKSCCEDAESRCRRRLQLAFIVFSALVLVLSYWAHNFAAAAGLGEPMPFHCSNYFGKYSTAFGDGKCGLDASECSQPSEWFAVRCAGICAARQVYPLATPVIGGGPYRADSRVCNAGVHAGVIGSGGGCFDVRIAGSAPSFDASKRNGIQSFGFDSWYPLTLEVRPSSSSSFCGFSAWWALLLLNVVLLFLLALLRPGRRLFFWCMVTLFYWYVALVAGIGPVSIREMMERLGSYAFFCLVAHAFLWNLGAAKLFFADTAAGAPFDVLLLEVLPAVPLMHLPLIALITGDYDINGNLFKDWRPAVLYSVGAASLVPMVCILLRRWYQAKCLRWLVCVLLGGTTATVILSLIFSTVDWGLHLHHYFTSLIGYLFARGRSRPAMIFRAFCLGALVDGICRWGQPQNLPIWSEGSGWLPDTGEIDAASRAAKRDMMVLWTGVDLHASNREVTLSWSLLGDLRERCLNQSRATNETAPVFVVEMNHIEVYRGPNLSWTFAFPPSVLSSTASRHVYFRVGTVERGMSRGVASASKVLAVNASWPPVEFYYSASADICDRVVALQNQPRWSLDYFI